MCKYICLQSLDASDTFHCAWFHEYSSNDFFRELPVPKEYYDVWLFDIYWLWNHGQIKYAAILVSLRLSVVHEFATVYWIAAIFMPGLLYDPQPSWHFWHLLLCLIQWPFVQSFSFSTWIYHWARSSVAQIWWWYYYRWWRYIWDLHNWFTYKHEGLNNTGFSFADLATSGQRQQCVPLKHVMTGILSHWWLCIKKLINLHISRQFMNIHTFRYLADDHQWIMQPWCTCWLITYLFHMIIFAISMQRLLYAYWGLGSCGQNID